MLPGPVTVTGYIDGILIESEFTDLSMTGITETQRLDLGVPFDQTLGNLFMFLLNVRDLGNAQWRSPI